jgi:aromatic ring hydroxylase
MEGKEQKDKNVEVKVSEEDRDGLKVRGALLGGSKTKWAFPNCPVAGCVET